MINPFIEVGAVPIDIHILKSLYPNHVSIHNKVCDLEKTGELIRLKKGLYVVSPKASGNLVSLSLIANHIYGPSYLTNKTALSFYGLIPERVYNIQSATTKHSRKFSNSLGVFEYTQCTNDYFAVGISQSSEQNIQFLIATPEKALCDLIIHTSGLLLRYKSETLSYLEEDLRLDMQAFYGMDVPLLKQCMLYGKKKTTLKIMIQLIEKHKLKSKL